MTFLSCDLTEMREAALSLRKAVTGFVVFVLTVPVAHGEDGWIMTYSQNICALKGTTIKISSTYRRINYNDAVVENTFWYTNMVHNEPVDLRTDAKFAGRVHYDYDGNTCTLTIRDLRESDSAVYKFKIITSQPDWTLTADSGVTLSVTGIQVKVSTDPLCTWKVQCHTSCQLTGHPTYIWYNRDSRRSQESSYCHYHYYSYSISCAVKGHENFYSTPVCVDGNSCTRVNYNERIICAFKGSSVNISAMYSTSHDITPKFWFLAKRYGQKRYGPKSVVSNKNPRFADHVQVLDMERGHSMLRIRELKESDSGQYGMGFEQRWSDWEDSVPGTTLTVKDPDLQVQVIQSSSGPTLICYSNCILPGRFPFAWYWNGNKILQDMSPIYRGVVHLGNSYSCGFEGHISPSVYAPRAPKVLKSHHNDMVKDSSLTLTCSSEARPPIKYAWYKNNQLLLDTQSQLVFSSIQPSHSGQYYCIAKNEMWKTESHLVSINVTYGPLTCTVSVSPPGGVIIEGTPVTLTCSTDANPAPSYIWYKENQILLRGSADTYGFLSINSGDSGVYVCKCENQYGQMNSSVLLDVQYAPRRPSVSVSPTGPIVEGSSVNLTCSSDANPAATYTWYKENEDSVKATGQVFTITNVRPELEGNYYCKVQNIRGRHNTTLQLTIETGALKQAMTGTISAVLLVFILLAVFLWIRRNRSCPQKLKRDMRPDVRAELDPDFNQRSDPQYASICFSQNHLPSHVIYSNIRQVQEREEEEEEEEEVEYSTVRFTSAGNEKGSRCQKDEEDLSALYSTVKKNTT